MSLVLDGISRRTPANPRAERSAGLERVSFTVAVGEMVALLGSAGSGRASLLRVIGGQDAPDAGRILLGGQDITRWPPARRPIGYVYQHDALFGHPTVFEAVAAALPEETEPATQAARVAALLDVVGLSGDGSWSPVTLPTGKRQRLTLARVLARQPRVLLVAEGFAAGAGPRRWLREVHRALGLTTLFVAHDAAEALAFGDRIVAMREGRVEQAGTPAAMLRAPASAAVASLLGHQRTAAIRGLDPRPGTAAVASGDIELTEAWLGAPARVVRSTAQGTRLVLELELVSDASRLQLELPSLGPAALLPPGTLIGVRLRRGGDTFGNA